MIHKRPVLLLATLVQREKKKKESLDITIQRIRAVQPMKALFQKFLITGSGTIYAINIYKGLY